MTICNAVRIVANDRRRKVVDQDSIDDLGYQREAILPVGDITDDQLITAIGEDYLRINSSPRRSIVVTTTEFEGQVGDTATVDGETVRCVSRAGEFDDDDYWSPAVGFTTHREEADIRLERALARLMSKTGDGSAAAADIENSRAKVPYGRLRELGKKDWSYGELAELETKPWQMWNVDDFYRLYAFEITGDWHTWDTETEDDPIFDEKVTTGDSSFVFSINGVVATLAPVVLPEESNKVTAKLYGYALLEPEDDVRVWMIENGGHINGSVSLLYTEPV